MSASIPTIDSVIGNTPLVSMQRLADGRGNQLCFKLEGQNPAGSVKDRPVESMFRRAEERGDIKPGDTLVEATSGNTGIAMALVAAIRGYRMKLVMPSNMTVERTRTMEAYGAEIIHVTPEQGMEGARDVAAQMAKEHGYFRMDQFANPDNPLSHYENTAAEIFEQTGGGITHFVSAMGTTGTVMGVSRYFRERKPSVRIIGVHPAKGESIPGIREWPPAYLPAIYQESAVDEIRRVGREQAQAMTERLAKEEGIFAGMSSGGAVHTALEVLAEQAEGAGALIVAIICDRGDRYISQLVSATEASPG